MRLCPQAVRRGESEPEKSPRRIVRIPSHSREEWSKFEIGPRCPAQALQITTETTAITAVKLTGGTVIQQSSNKDLPKGISTFFQCILSIYFSSVSVPNDFNRLDCSEGDSLVRVHDEDYYFSKIHRLCSWEFRVISHWRLRCAGLALAPGQRSPPPQRSRRRGNG